MGRVILSRRIPRSWIKPLPRKEEVLRLLQSCGSPGAKLAVALAARSGLKPGQVKSLVYQNLVEFSTMGNQLSQVPSRIELRNRVSWKKYYTFLSTVGCEQLLVDLGAKSQPVSPKEAVLSGKALAEAAQVLRKADVRWFELRHFFRMSCNLAEMEFRALRPEMIQFMLGNAVKGDFPIARSFFDSKVVGMLRQGYSQVEKQSFR